MGVLRQSEFLQRNGRWKSESARKRFQRLDDSIGDVTRLRSDLDHAVVPLRGKNQRAAAWRALGLKGRPSASVKALPVFSDGMSVQSIRTNRAGGIEVETPSVRLERRMFTPAERQRFASGTADAINDLLGLTEEQRRVWLITSNGIMRDSFEDGGQLVELLASYIRTFVPNEGEVEDVIVGVVVHEPT